MVAEGSFLPVGRVVGSRPARAGWTLLKLAAAAPFTCGTCGGRKVSRTVAVEAAGGQTVHCNGCYGRRVARHEEPGGDERSVAAPAQVPVPVPSAAATAPADEPGAGQAILTGHTDPGEPADVRATDAEVQWAFALCERHLDERWCPLPPEAARRIAGKQRKTRTGRPAGAGGWAPGTMAVRGGPGFPVSLVDGRLAVNRAGGTPRVTGVHWDRSDVTLGTRIQARLDRHQLRLFVTPLKPRIVVAGQVVTYAYDVRVLVRDLPTARVEPLGRANSPVDARVLETIRKLGYLDERGRALLPLDALTGHVRDVPPEKVRKAVNLLVNGKRLTWETGSRAVAGDLLNFPAREGEQTIRLICYVPFPELTPGEHTRRVTHLPGVGSRQEVAGHLMKINGQASEEARAAYAEAHRAAGLAGPRRIPKGHTYRRPHVRGDA